MDYAFWIIGVLCIANASAEIILRVDPLALLSATLRTYQKAACDTDQVVISCPRGTSISIEFAQYNKFIAKDGITIDELCPTDNHPTQIRAKSKHLLRGSTFGSPTQIVPANRYVGAIASGIGLAVVTSNNNTTVTEQEQHTDGDTSPENCMWPNALQVFPFIYVLMSHKSEAAYLHVFQYIEANLFKFEPNSFVTDYEKAMRNSLQNVFPRAKCTTCWFHFCQAVRKKASKLPAFVTSLHKNKEANRLFRKFLILPLMRPEDIQSAFEFLNGEANGAPFKKNGESIFKDFLIYFNRQWMERYSLLQTVVEACQKKKHCKFNGSPQYYGLGASGVGDTSGSSSYHSSTSTSTSGISMDPCPKRRKIVEIAYKCRPYEFRSKVACHNDVAQLECNPYSRIAVYSASFGRTEYESIQCPQPQGVKEETCLASYATETVMQICHGRRRCNLAADANTFGSPCHQNSRMYLKVVYTCVPKQVLKDRYESDVEPDELEDFEGDVNELYDDDQFYKESEAIPKLYSNVTRTNGSVNATSSNSAGGINTTAMDADGTGVNPVMTHSSDLSLEDDQERLYLYLLIAGSAGVIVCIVIVAVRVIMVKRRNHNADSHSQSSGKGGGETTIPNGFNDTISEIDADIDLTIPVPVPSVSKNENYITYGPTSSLYGSLGPSNVSHTSSTMLLPPTVANPLICGGIGAGPRQSPDIIGISNTYMTAGTTTTNIVGGGGLPPTSATGTATAGNIVGAGQQPSNVSSSAIGTTVLVPISPTFRGPGYIMDHDGTLHRPPAIATPPKTTMVAMPPPPTPSSTHRPQQQQQQCDSFPYDGTAPRTLSTGVPVSSQFYYG